MSAGMSAIGVCAAGDGSPESGDLQESQLGGGDRSRTGDGGFAVGCWRFCSRDGPQGCDSQVVTVQPARGRILPAASAPSLERRASKATLVGDMSASQLALTGGNFRARNDHTEDLRRGTKIASITPLMRLCAGSSSPRSSLPCGLGPPPQNWHRQMKSASGK